MIFESMSAVQAEGVAMLDAHPDLEVSVSACSANSKFEFRPPSPKPDFPSPTYTRSTGRLSEMEI